MYAAVAEWDGGHLAFAMSTTPREAFFLAWQEAIRQKDDPPFPHCLKDDNGKDMTREDVLPGIDWATTEGGKFQASGFSNGFDSLESCQHPIRVFEPRFDVKGYVIPLNVDKTTKSLVDELDRTKKVLKSFKDLLGTV